MAALAVLLAAVSLGWAADVYRRVGLLPLPEQFYAAILAMALALVFLSVRARKGDESTAIPWYDMLAAGISALAGGYIALRFPELAELIADRPLDGIIAGAVVILLVIEALRRTVGLILTGMVVVFIGYALLGHLVPGVLQGREIALPRLVYYLAWDPTAILGTPMAVVSTIVMAFVFFGQVLTRSGGSEFFTDISIVLMGRFRGGPAKIAVTASGLFGSISGSAVSNVVSTGVITIPLMKQGGYRPQQAGAIEAVASTGGQLMPPIMGAAAFLMAEILEIPYAEVVIAAALPAVLYYAALFILADLEAARSGLVRVPQSEIPKAGPVLKAGWYFPIPFVVLIVCLFNLNYSPELAALAATGSIFVLSAVFGYKGHRMGWRDVIGCLRGTGHAVLDVIMIGAAAGIVIGVLNISGLGFGLSLALIELAGGNTILLLVISAFVCILLGMGMPTVGVYLLLAFLVAPSLVEIGIDQIAAHLFILYFGMMSMITPPVAIAAFAAATLARTEPMATGFMAMRFGWMAYVVPFLFIAQPALLMQGTVTQIVVAGGSALAGVWLVSVAMAGYFVRPVGRVERVLFLLAGIALLFPAKVAGLPFSSDIVGVVLGAALIGRELLGRKALQPV